MATRRPPSDIAERSGGASANDRIAGLFTGHAIDLLRLEAGQRRKVRSLLTQMEREIVSQLAVIDPTEPMRAAYRKKRLETLLKQVKETVRASYRSISTEMLGELKELADIEGVFVASAINKGVGFQLATVTFTRQQLVAIATTTLVQGSPVGEWWSRQAGDTYERFMDQMRVGMAIGETNQQLVQRIKGGVRNGEVITGFMDISRSNADRLVRSSVQSIANEAREAVYEQNADIIKGIQWVATLDGRTTVGCGARDGKLYQVGSHEPMGHDLPWDGGPGSRHWNCRSSSAPVTKSWRELGFDIGYLPPGTRASIDGQVPADQSFEQWLGKQSKARQDEALGTGRADLWRDGKISYRDLLDQNGRELSLAQLRERVAA